MWVGIDSMLSYRKVVMLNPITLDTHVGASQRGHEWFGLEEGGYVVTRRHSVPLFTRRASVLRPLRSTRVQGYHPRKVRTVFNCRVIRATQCELSGFLGPFHAYRNNM